RCYQGSASLHDPLHHLLHHLPRGLRVPALHYGEGKPVLPLGVHHAGVLAVYPGWSVNLHSSLRPQRRELQLQQPPRLLFHPDLDLLLFQLHHRHTLYGPEEEISRIRSWASGGGVGWVGGSNLTWEGSRSHCVGITERGGGWGEGRKRGRGPNPNHIWGGGILYCQAPILGRKLLADMLMLP
ncbi:epithelial membrane protein 1, isoform CRA_a, partial [Mus musculus]